MSVLAIDPGTTHSAWCLLDGIELLAFDKEENWQVFDRCKTGGFGNDGSPISVFAIEMVASYGMPVGREVFETVAWTGRFQGVLSLWAANTILVYRKDVKLHLCNSVRAKDANIRQALIDSFPAVGGGRIPQVGTKSSPGPLYGVSGDVWASLAVACYVRDTVLEKV